MTTKMYSKFEIIKENEQLIRNMISDNKPLFEIARVLNIKYDTLKKHLKTLNIDYKGNPQRKGLSHLEGRVNATEYFDNSKCISASRLRRILIRDGFKECVCERCGLSEWMGQPIPLELHHKDLNHHNNNLENLQILCSNCHMQIHGYSNTKKI